MKLLIITQKVDKDDPILGFFHNWIERLAESASSTTVICLELGRNELPDNVKILSLGKEEKDASRMQYVKRFYSYIWNERNEYDVVFVHMNQEYILLGGLLWKLLRKKIFMWRNHPYGNFLTRIAVGLSKKVYCASAHSYTARFKKTRLMPAGIDTDTFKPQSDVKRHTHTLLYAGRISPIKHIDVLIETANLLRTEGMEFKLSIVGNPPKGEEKYYSALRTKAALLETEGVVVFYEGISQEHMPELYSSHEIFVNLTDAGSFDKTVLEAMACSTLPLVSNIDFKLMFPLEYREVFCFRENDPKDLSVKIQSILASSQSEKEKVGKKFREIVVEKHSLIKLMDDFREDFSAS